MSIGSALFGSMGKYRREEFFSPQQNRGLDQLLELTGSIPQLQEYLMSFLQPQESAEDRFSAPAMRQFQEEILPGIAERFTGMGDSAQMSSAFGQQLGAAGAGLSERLSQMAQEQDFRQRGQAGQLGQNAIMQLMQMMQPGFQQRSQETYQPGKKGFFQQVAPALGNAAIKGGMGFLAGGPAGAAAGALGSFL